MDDLRRHFGELKLIAGNANKRLATMIAEELGQPLEKTNVGRFDDGEVQVDLDCVVRGTDVFIIQPICQSHSGPQQRPCLTTGTPGGSAEDVCTYQSINDNLMELLVMIDAARRASAGRVTAVVPYMAYAKQEKKKRAHEPITAKLVANLITEAGADRLLTVDLHTPAIEGFFDIPVDHMRMALRMAAFFRMNLGLEEAVVVSPDAGGVARATEFRDCLKTDKVAIARDEMAIAFKRRTAKGEPAIIDIVGDVAGRAVVVFDDMIQSGATLLQVVDRLREEKKATAVHAAAVHADFTVGALDKLQNNPNLQTVVLSDTTATAFDSVGGKVQLVTSARILAQAIWRIHTQQSVGWIFDTLRREGELPKVE
jgi:ribose-phosphate pyrophosphokinase